MKKTYIKLTLPKNTNVERLKDNTLVYLPVDEKPIYLPFEQLHGIMAEAGYSSGESEQIVGSMMDGMEKATGMIAVSKYMTTVRIEDLDKI